MIQIQPKGGLLCSTFVCDVCRKPIQDASKALVAIPGCFRPREKGEPFDVQHVHKGKCQRALEERSGAGYGDLELRDHIASLLVSLRWTKGDWERAMANQGNGFTDSQEEE